LIEGGIMKFHTNGTAPGTVDEEGIIRLQKNNAVVLDASVSNLQETG
jgi:uncharacterized protein (DUF362 family)